MSRLSPKTRRTGDALAPADADSRTVSVYFGNCVWHLGYLVKVFETEPGYEAVIEKLKSADGTIREARQIWKDSK